MVLILGKLFLDVVPGDVAERHWASGGVWDRIVASPRSPRFDDRTSASVRARIFDAKAKDARSDVLHWPNPPSSC